jgi:Septum formation
MPDDGPNWGQDLPQWQDSNRSTIALVFGILGVVGCGLLAPFAWWLGRKELDAIEAGIRSPRHRGNAKAAKILGIVGTVITVVLVPLIAVISIRIAGEAALRDANGVVIRTGTFLLKDLQVGDCGDWPQGSVFFSVTLHPCDEPHDFELYALVSHPDGPKEPYREKSLQAWSLQTCFERFEPYVGVASEEFLTLSFSYFYPPDASWREGDRIVQCALHAASEGERLIGSKIGLDLDARALLRGWQ